MTSPVALAPLSPRGRGVGGEGEPLHRRGRSPPHPARKASPPSPPRGEGKDTDLRPYIALLRPDAHHRGHLVDETGLPGCTWRATSRPLWDRDAPVHHAGRLHRRVLRQRQRPTSPRRSSGRSRGPSPAGPRRTPRPPAHRRRGVQRGLRVVQPRPARRPSPCTPAPCRRSRCRRPSPSASAAHPTTPARARPSATFTVPRWRGRGRAPRPSPPFSSL